MDVLVFGGTVEGRMMVECLCAHPDVFVVACTATDYGADMLAPRKNLLVEAARLNRLEMEELMRARDFACVIDATHPYAVAVTENVSAAARACGLEYVRIVREGQPEGPWQSASSCAEAASMAAGMAGNILLTTGSKDLATFVAAIPDYKERLFVRVLPARSSLENAELLGIPASHVVAMQGPFSFEFNCALIHELDIACMVTKASGAAGGFDEKIQAASACGVRLIVVDRPVSEEGLSFDEARSYVTALIESRSKGAFS